MGQDLGQGLDAVLSIVMVIRTHGLRWRTQPNHAVARWLTVAAKSLVAASMLAMSAALMLSLEQGVIGAVRDGIVRGLAGIAALVLVTTLSLVGALAVFVFVSAPVAPTFAPDKSRWAWALQPAGLIGCVAAVLFWVSELDDPWDGAAGLAVATAAAGLAGQRTWRDLSRLCASLTCARYRPHPSTRVVTAERADNVRDRFGPEWDAPEAIVDPDTARAYARAARSHGVLRRMGLNLVAGLTGAFLAAGLLLIVSDDAEANLGLAVLGMIPLVAWAAAQATVAGTRRFDQLEDQYWERLDEITQTVDRAKPPP